jgi:hypothetical protein
MKKHDRPRLQIVEEISVPAEAAGPGRPGFTVQIVLFLSVCDAAIFSLLGALMRVVIDGFAEHGAAHHGYSLSLHERAPRTRVDPKQPDRPQLSLVPGGNRPSHHSSMSSPSSSAAAVASDGYRTWVR